MSEQKHTPEEIKAAFDEAKKAWEDRERTRDAAPEMLEALKAVMEEKAPRYHDCTDDGLPKCAWCLADEAIAKAEGLTP